MAFMRLTTGHGHVMAEVYSCFQKYVRRGAVDDALYWGAQIACGGGAYKGFPNALKKRLMQHALEDVGNPEFAIRLLAAKPKSWDDLVPWIRALCNIPKTRAAAWMNRVAVQYVDKEAPTALLQEAAAVLEKHRDGKIAELEAEFGKDARRVYKELNNEVLIFHCLLLVKHGVVKAPAFEVGGAGGAGMDVDLTTPREVPDFALDKHTARGKRLGRGYAHFLETMLVAPRLFEGEDPFEAEARALYTDGKELRVRHILAKKVEEKEKPAEKPTEKKKPAVKRVKKAVEEKPMAAAENPLETCTHVLQAQLLTGKHKPRVWYATDKDGKQIVVKGPVSASERKTNLASEALKEKLGLPRTNMREVGEFLVMDSLVDYTKFPTSVRSSKLETDVRVPLNTSNPGWNTKMLENKKLATALMKGLLFRKIAGANDTCTRNFVVTGEEVYSIDDASIGVETATMWKKGLMKEKPAYVAALARVWSEMEATIREWRTLLAENPFACAQLEVHSKQEGWKW